VGLAAPTRGRRGASRLAALLDVPAVHAVRARLVTLLVASAVFLVALDNGTYAVTDRAVVALAMWWAVALGIALRFLPRERIPRSAWTAVIALALFAGLAASNQHASPKLQSGPQV